MKLLAIDTALDEASVAVWEGDDPATGSITDAVCSERAAASRELLPAIDRLLAGRGWAVAQLDGVAVTIGPGSFTGLRIGVSLVKGLVSARRVPVAAIGTLDAVALASGCTGHVAAILDARRGECYVRLFAIENGVITPRSEELLIAPEAWAASLTIDGPLWCVGAGAMRHADALRAGLGARATILHHPVMTAASAALRLGARALASGQATPPEALLPRYVRRSDAEANLERGVVGSRRRRMLGWDPAHGRT